MSIRVVALISGNLAARTLFDYCKTLEAHKNFKISYISDGAVYSNIDFDIEGSVKIDDFKSSNLPQADLFLCSPKTPGALAAKLVKYYQEKNVPTIAICTDIGSGTFKYGQFSTLPDVIAVSDAITFNCFIKSGICKTKLRLVGNPYLDAALIHLNSKKHILGKYDIGLLEVPNSWDWKNKNKPDYYNEREIKNKFMKICTTKNLNSTIRSHPRQAYFNKSDTQNSSYKDDSIYSYILSHKLLVSTYSTALILARIAGKPAISIQPKKAPLVRKEIFSAVGVSIVDSYKSLENEIERKIGDNQVPCAPFWHEPGNFHSNMNYIYESLLAQ